MMANMKMPRTFSALRLWVLAWFMASLGVAIAAPIVHPQPIQVICSSTGTLMLMMQSDDGTVEKMGSAGMDCPLCSPAGAPPAVATGSVIPSLPLAHALQPIEAARIAAATAAPLPARGPPALS
jgi:hypothetical protein